LKIVRRIRNVIEPILFVLHLPKRFDISLLALDPEARMKFLGTLYTFALHGEKNTVERYDFTERVSVIDSEPGTPTRLGKLY